MTKPLLLSLVLMAACTTQAQGKKIDTVKSVLVVARIDNKNVYPGRGTAVNIISFVGFVVTDKSRHFFVDDPVKITYLTEDKKELPEGDIVITTKKIEK